jgi:hypothetical protein
VASTEMQECRTMPREALLPCFSELIDIDKDGSLNTTEIRTFLDTNKIHAITILMHMCDLNRDGVLTVADDWTPEDACARSQPMITRVCYICVRAGWSFGQPPAVQKSTPK